MAEVQRGNVVPGAAVAVDAGREGGTRRWQQGQGKLTQQRSLFPQRHHSAISPLPCCSGSSAAACPSHNGHSVAAHAGTLLVLLRGLAHALPRVTSHEKVALPASFPCDLFGRFVLLSRLPSPLPRVLRSCWRCWHRLLAAGSRVGALRHCWLDDSAPAQPTKTSGRNSRPCCTMGHRAT